MRKVCREHVNGIRFGILIAALVLLLTACGRGAGSTGSSSSSTGASSAPTVGVTPTAVAGYGSSNGCPSDMVVASAQSNPNVIVNQTNANTAVAAHDGDIIEFRLPFGQKWHGPNSSMGTLELQSPPGYASKNTHACVWRFVAKGSGSTQLNFTAQAICGKGKMCAMYVLNLNYTVNVK